MSVVPLHSVLTAGISLQCWLLHGHREQRLWTYDTTHGMDQNPEASTDIPDTSANGGILVSADSQSRSQVFICWQSRMR